MVLIKNFLEDEEDREILWLAGFERQDPDGWFVRVATQFVGSRKVKLWCPPIGLLPLLTPGTRISGGYLLRTSKRGVLWTVTIPNLADGEEISSAVISEDLYSFEGHRPGVQHLFRYRAGGEEVLIPSIELIRCLFLHSKTLANTLMQPGALMTLFRPEPVGIHSELHLQFTRQMPKENLSAEFAQEFAWLAVHPDGRRAWDSVYERSCDKPYVSFHPPPLANCTLRFRGVHAKGRWLVLEIDTLTRKSPPCDHLFYSHPSIRRRVPVSLKPAGGPAEDAERLERAKRAQCREVVLESTGSAVDTHQRALNVPAKTSSFDRLIEVQKVYCVVETDAGDESGAFETGKRRATEAPEGAARVRILSSVTPESSGASVSPIEFKVLEVASWEDVGELEPLKKVILLIADRNPDIRISMSPCYLREGRKISEVGRRRRTYLVVVFERVGEPPVVLLDVDHSGDRALSSMVLRYRKRLPGLDIETDIKLLMDDLVENSGKWPNPLGRELRERAHCERMAKLCRRQSAAQRMDYLDAWADKLFDRLFG
jgi:hypothetical protein